MNVLGELEEIFRTLFDKPELSLNRTTTAADIEGWDSLMQMQIIMTIQDSFGIRIRMREAAIMKNVGELVDLIEKSIGGK